MGIFSFCVDRGEVTGEALMDGELTTGSSGLSPMGEARLCDGSTEAASLTLGGVTSAGETPVCT